MKTGWWRKNCYQVFPLCLTQRTSCGSIHLLADTVLRYDIEDGNYCHLYALHLRKLHGVCSTPSPPLPHLCCYVATALTKQSCCLSFIHKLSSFINIKSEISCWRPIAAVGYLIVYTSKGLKKTWRHYSTVDEAIMQIYFRRKLLTIKKTDRFQMFCCKIKKILK